MTGTSSRHTLGGSRLSVAALLGCCLWLVSMQTQAGEGLPLPAPDASFETADGARSISEFRGRKVMLRMFSTWCSSCAVAFDALQSRQPELKSAGLNVVALRNFENGRYPDPTLRAFVERFGKPLLDESNWTFGEVTSDMASKYNPRRFPDIYFLIDEAGMVQRVERAPGATIDTITPFAGLE